MPEQILSAIDSLQRLSLGALPLQGKALERSYLVKNARLEGMVELFHHDGGGRGFVTTRELPHHLDAEGCSDADVELLDKVGALPSYDCYTLRHAFKRWGVVPRDPALLSPPRAAATAAHAYYMETYKQPLINFIYGEEGQPAHGAPDSYASNRDIRLRVDSLAQKLNLDVRDVPVFLDEYNDQFMSMAYFEMLLERMQEPVNQMLKSIAELKDTPAIAQRPPAVQAIGQIERVFKTLVAEIQRSFAAVKERAAKLWDNVTGPAYRSLREQVGRYQLQIGAALCAMAAKAKAWLEHFPHAESGSPDARMGFVMTDISPGLSRFRPWVQDAAPRPA